MLNLAPDYSTGVPLISRTHENENRVNSFSLVGLPSNQYKVAQVCIERCPYESTTLEIHQENVSSRERERFGLDVEK